MLTIYIYRKLSFLLLSTLLAMPLCAQAQLKIFIGTDPADENSSKQKNAAVSSPTLSLISALGAQTVVRQTSDLTDAMRASRTQENDVMIVPAHVTASAISHSYQLLARNKQSGQFVLVVRKEIDSMEQLAGKRLYLTQQDSVRTYLAKSIFNDADVSLKALKQIIYGKTSGAGLFALSSNQADATIAEKEEALAWLKLNPNHAKILKSTPVVPSGMALIVHKNMASSDKQKLLKWISSNEASQCGFGKLNASSSADEEQYRYMAGLGILTPVSVAGVTLVSTDQVVKLVNSGIKLVDTRSAKEYEQEHIPGAVHLPYIEKSLKDREFDAALDDFSALAKLDLEKPVIFYCNGPECWKSYKASRVALSKGARQVYWYRNGMPEWREKNAASSKK